MGKRVTIGFAFTPDWMKKWREIFLKANQGNHVA